MRIESVNKRVNKHIDFQMLTQYGKVYTIPDDLMPLEDIRLWSIKDAKEGDILTCGNAICIFDCLNEKAPDWEWDSKLYYKDDAVNYTGGVHVVFDTVPATFSEIERLTEACHKKKTTNGATMFGWIARHGDGGLFYYEAKPKRDTRYGGWLITDISSSVICLQKNIFPEITYNHEPIKVKLEITRVS